MKDPSPRSLVLYSLAALLLFAALARYLWKGLLRSEAYAAVAPWLWIAGAALWLVAYRLHRRDAADRRRPGE